MTTATHHSAMPAPCGWLTRAEAWLDAKGKGAWIAAMVLGFIFFWPVGLALLAYMIWSKRMFSKSCRSQKHSRKCHRSAPWKAAQPSGNRAFDAYKADTLTRLEAEQEAFESFLERLRDARDKSEFDQFMDDQEKRARGEDTAA